MIFRYLAIAVFIFYWSFSQAQSSSVLVKDQNQAVSLDTSNLSAEEEDIIANLEILENMDVLEEDVTFLKNLDNVELQDQQGGSNEE